MKSKILIVDDNPMLRETVRSILESKFPALEILEAGNGMEALAQVHAHLPIVILMDIRLPGENGLILTRKVKALYPKIVIIIFTSYDMPEYREAAFKNGAEFFLSKSAQGEKKLNTAIEFILADNIDAV